MPNTECNDFDQWVFEVYASEKAQLKYQIKPTYSKINVEDTEEEPPSKSRSPIFRPSPTKIAEPTINFPVGR